MRVDPQRILDNARRAETEDLLDRVTLYRDQMEPDAVEVIEAELAGRGITPDDIRSHQREYQHRVVRRSDGAVAKCSFCPRAATTSHRGWHKLWHLVPIFKRTYYACDEHKGMTR